MGLKKCTQHILNMGGVITITSKCRHFQDYFHIILPIYQTGLSRLLLVSSDGSASAFCIMFFLHNQHLG